MQLLLIPIILSSSSGVDAFIFVVYMCAFDLRSIYEFCGLNVYKTLSWFFSIILIVEDKQTLCMKPLESDKL